MDVFFEQLIPMPMKGMRLAAFLGTWIIGIALIVFAILFLGTVIPALGFLAACGIGWLTWKLSGQFRIEYEYALTNGDFDIDCITNKRKRRRVISFSCKEVEAILPYRKEEPAAGNVSRRIFACPAEQATHVFRIRSEKEGLILLVLAPDERVREGLLKCLPKSFDTSAIQD